MANENVISKRATAVTLRDGNVYQIQPLSLNELIGIWPIIEKLEKSKDSISKELLESMKEVVYIALQKKVAKEKIGDLVDLVDIKNVIAAIVGTIT